MAERAVPKIRDVARLAGVSPATVSNVLGQRKSVDPVLVERVQRACAELGYRVHRAASQLRSGRAKVVAVLVPSLENPFFTSLIAALARFGKRVPEDISLIGFDDYAWMRAYRPPITAVRQPIDAIAAQGWRWLAERIGGSYAPTPDRPEP